MMQPMRQGMTMMMSAMRDALADLQWNWGEAYERHEAPFDRAGVKGLRRCTVAAV
jgi:hypothetical protein